MKLRVLTISQNWFLLPEMVSVVAGLCDPCMGFTRTTRSAKCKQYGGHGENLQHRMSACSYRFSLPRRRGSSFRRKPWGYVCRAFKLLCVYATLSGWEFPGILNQPSLTITAMFSGAILAWLHRPLKCSAISCLQVTTFLRLIGLESPVFTHVKILLLQFGLLPTKKVGDKYQIASTLPTSSHESACRCPWRFHPVAQR